MNFQFGASFLLLLISDSKVSRKREEITIPVRQRGIRLGCVPIISLPLHPFHFFFAALTILLIAPLILQIPNCFFHPLALRPLNSYPPTPGNGETRESGEAAFKQKWRPIFELKRLLN